MLEAATGIDEPMSPKAAVKLNIKLANNRFITQIVGRENACVKDRCSKTSFFHNANAVGRV